MEDSEVQVLPAVARVTVGPYTAVTQDRGDGKWAVVGCVF